MIAYIKYGNGAYVTILIIASYVAIGVYTYVRSYIGAYNVIAIPTH